MSVSAIALGGNVGDKKRFVDAAVEALAARGDIRLRRRSSYFRTEPWGATDQDWFVNACILVETDLAPLALLERCLAVETGLGRVRDRRWGPRTIDLDLLLYDRLTMRDNRLELPHPRLAERAFVLVPLAEIAPDWQVGDLTVADMAAMINRTGVERLPWPVPEIVERAEA